MGLPVDNGIALQMVVLGGLAFKFGQDWLIAARDRRWKEEDEERQRKLTDAIDNAVAERTHDLFERLLTEADERKGIMTRLSQCLARQEQAARIFAALVGRLPQMFTAHEQTVIAEITKVGDKVDGLTNSVGTVPTDQG